jgi:hypothetical protein
LTGLALPAVGGAFLSVLLCFYLMSTRAAIFLLRKTLRAPLGQVQRLGVLSLVMVWLALLRALPQDFPKNFP